MENNGNKSESVIQILEKWSKNPDYLLTGSLALAILAGVNIGIIYLGYRLGLEVRFLEIVTVVISLALSILFAGISLHIAKKYNDNPEKQSTRSDIK